MSFLCPGGRSSLAAIAFACSILTLVMGGFSSPAVAGPFGPAGPPTVLVAPVRQADVASEAAYVGHVEAVEEVALQARVSGIIEEVGFHEGGMVAAGDLLYRIESAPYRARLDAARARLQMAQAERERAKAQTAVARAVLDRAEKRLARMRLAGGDSVAAADLEAAETAVAEAKAQVAVAEAQEAGASSRIAEAKAAVASARIELSYTEIRAPITGRIGRTAWTRGNLVGPDSGVLARIVRLDPVRVVYAVSETELARLQRALAAADGGQGFLLRPRLRLPDGSAYPVAGRVLFVDNRVDSATGTVAVRAEFANPDGALLPGRYVTVLVKTAPPRPLPVVPQAAVLTTKEGSAVLMVNGKGVVEARPVTLGPAVGADVAVTSGLRPGERIVVAGMQKVRPGMPAKAVMASGGGKAAPPAEREQNEKAGSAKEAGR